MFEIYIDIKPKPAPRPRFRNNHAYMPVDYQKYLAEIKRQLQLHLPAYLSADIISLQVTFFKNRPINSTSFGDLDNLLKGIMDAMNGIVYKDDAQIITVNAAKKKSTREGIAITIQYLGVSNDDD